MCLLNYLPGPSGHVLHVTGHFSMTSASPQLALNLEHNVSVSLHPTLTDDTTVKG